MPVFPTVDVSGAGVGPEYGDVLLAVTRVSLPGGQVTVLPDSAAVPAGCNGDWWLVNQ